MIATKIYRAYMQNNMSYSQQNKMFYCQAIQFDLADVHYEDCGYFTYK